MTTTEATLHKHNPRITAILTPLTFLIQGTFSGIGVGGCLGLLYSFTVMHFSPEIFSAFLRFGVGLCWIIAIGGIVRPDNLRRMKALWTVDYRVWKNQQAGRRETH